MLSSQDNLLNFPPEIVEQIASRMSDKTLARFCQANKYCNENCFNNDIFWRQRLIYKNILILDDDEYKLKYNNMLIP